MDERRSLPAAPGGKRWLVGFRFRAATGRLVRHYYLVDGATDAEHARQLAARRVHSVAERGARRDATVDPDWTEIRQMRRDPVGEWHLPGSGGSVPR
ncbi:hypothetical protein [Streptomyces melanosporofaciens]|uniref:hypothetical protein n=1 Tax=Streptomyces melanosporofaciens TaxID=67327 RepID=UPI000B81ECB1|nr:hypothetical protein [Streptomyces melanosporofaciens]